MSLEVETQCQENFLVFKKGK